MRWNKWRFFIKDGEGCVGLGFSEMLLDRRIRFVVSVIFNNFIVLISLIFFVVCEWVFLLICLLLSGFIVLMFIVFIVFVVVSLDNFLFLDCFSGYLVSL